MQELQKFVQSMAQFSWALAVFGFSQGGSLLRGVTTTDPTAGATQSFNAVTNSMERQYDAIDQAIYNTGNTVLSLVVPSVFQFFQPSNFYPQTILQTSENLARWSFGIVTQLIPGGRLGTGGPPVGWGPVNWQDATLFYVPPGTPTGGTPPGAPGGGT
jgi:hypothetical protein